MILYDYRPAPNARRVRIFVAEKGLEIETQQIDLGADEQFSDAYSAINPQQVVPALKLDDGTVICESVAICRYLEGLHPEPSLFGQTPLEQARIEMWHRFVELEGMVHCRDAFRNKVAGMAGRALAGYRDGMEQIPELVERAAGCLGKFFVSLEGRLSGHAFIAGDKYSIADIAGLVTTDFATRLKLGPVPEHAAIADWHARMSARPSATA